MPIQTDPTRTSHPPAPTRSQPPPPHPGTPLRDPRRLLQNTSGTQKQAAGGAAASPNPLSASERKVEEERSGEVARKASRGPLAPRTRSGEESGAAVLTPGRPWRVLGSRSPAPGCAPARLPRPLRAEPSRARRLPTETSPLPLGRPRARPPAPL